MVNHSQDFKPIEQILKGLNLTRDKYFSREFQAYGYYLAKELGDFSHKALYIKYAKEIPRPLLDQALSFVKDAGKVKSRARLFMWKLKELKTQGKTGEKKRG